IPDSVSRSAAKSATGAQLATRAATEDPWAGAWGRTARRASPANDTWPACTDRLAAGDWSPAFVMMSVIVPPNAASCFCSPLSDEVKTEAGVSPGVINTGVTLVSSVFNDGSLETTIVELKV